MNASIESGIFLKKLKIAKVVSIFKVGDETAPNNYMPISLRGFNRSRLPAVYRRLLCLTPPASLP